MRISDWSSDVCSSDLAQVIELLKGLRRRFGFSCLFIAHDLPVVRDFCDHLIVMKDGKILETGPTAEIFDNPRHPYTRDLLAASPLVAQQTRTGGRRNDVDPTASPTPDAPAKAARPTDL